MDPVVYICVFLIAYFCTERFIFWVHKCVKRVHAEKCAIMQGTIRTLKMVPKPSVEWSTLHTNNERCVGDVAEAVSQTSQ